MKQLKRKKDRIYKRMVFQDVGQQTMKDSNPEKRKTKDVALLAARARQSRGSPWAEAAKTRAPDKDTGSFPGAASHLERGSGRAQRWRPPASVFAEGFCWPQVC